MAYRNFLRGMNDWARDRRSAGAGTCAVAAARGPDVTDPAAIEALARRIAEDAHTGQADKAGEPENPHEWCAADLHVPPRREQWGMHIQWAKQGQSR